MTYGYTGKIAEVDLSSGEIKDLKLPKEILKTYVGGRGLGTKILWDRLGKKWREVDPLGPENMFLALTGPLTGYIYGMRVCGTGKSPLSNGIVGSTAAGEFPMELKTAGYDGVIAKGKAERPVYILVIQEVILGHQSYLLDNPFFDQQAAAGNKVCFLHRRHIVLTVILFSATPHCPFVVKPIYLAACRPNLIPIVVEINFGPQNTDAFICFAYIYEFAQKLTIHDRIVI